MQGLEVLLPGRGSPSFVPEMDFLPVVLRFPSNSPTATEYPEETARINLSGRAKQREGHGQGRRGTQRPPSPNPALCRWENRPSRGQGQPGATQLIRGGKGKWELAVAGKPRDQRVEAPQDLTRGVGGDSQRAGRPRREVPGLPR